MSADEAGGTTSMPATNGERYTATPDPSVLATPGKRKRGSSQEDKVAQDASTTASQADEKAKLQETLRNLVDILSKTDTELQLLSCPLPTSPVKPRSKRAKVSGDKDESTSIQARVASDRYTSLSEFLSDIEKASTAVIERNKNQASGDQADGSPVAETVNRIAAFKKLLNSLVRQASVSQSSVKAETSEDDTEAAAKPTTTSAIEVRNDSLVLTLFGNPSNPKQLYSSLQKSVKVPLPSDDPEAQKYVEVQTPLREVGLPNGITTTKVGPYDFEKKPKEPKKTFGEVFAPRASLPQLEPPRRARSSSRTAVSSWIDPFEAITNYKTFPGERNNYCLAPLPSGQWLQYGGVSSSPSFWGRRQKQQPSQQHGEERFHEDPALWVDEDSAVLQGVYSSFAPSFDSSGAVLQVDSKDLVWWSKKGTRRLHTLLSVSDQEEPGEIPDIQPGSIGDLDESALEEMVKSFEPEDFADASAQTDTPKKEQDDKLSQETDELLRDISDLLETLSSYQKIRSLELSTSGDKAAEPKGIVPDPGTPDSPTEAERAVYDTLKANLALLISQLPPFAVAKLNGDQLADLNISQKILIENPDYPGTMEQDDYSIQKERAAAVAASAAAPAPNSANNRTSTPSRSGNFQPQYNQRAYSANMRVQSQPNFQTPQPYFGAARPPAPFTPGNPQHYSGARPPQTTPGQRPGFYPGYSQQNPQFNQANAAPQQFQRPGPNGFNPYAPQPGPPSTQGSPQPFTPRPGQPAPYNSAYGPGRSASPQKPPTYVNARAPFMTPGSNPQQRFMQHPQQAATPYTNFPSNQATPAANTYSNSAAAMTYARSAAEQAALMDRNRRELAAQASSSTPQPPSEGSQDRSVTPGNKQNGTPVPT